MRRMRLWGWRGVVAWLVLASVCLFAKAEPVPPPASGSPSARPFLQLDSQTYKLELSPYLSYYHDAEGTDDLPAARQVLRANGFAPLPGNKTAFGFQPGALWFHLRIVNANLLEPRWLLVQKYALSDHIEVHTLHADGRVDTHIGGDALPFEARSIRYRPPNFWIHVPAGPPVDLLVRGTSPRSMEVPVWLDT